MPEVNEKLPQLDNPEIDDMYGTYLDQLIAKPQVNFKCIIKGFALDMPVTMRLKAEDKAHVKDEEVRMADDALKEQTEESYKEIMARRLKRKRDLESDGTGAREPKVALSSTSGLGQGSKGSSTLAHQK